MWPFSRNGKHVYQAVPSKDVEPKAEQVEEDGSIESTNGERFKNHWCSNRYILAFLCILFVIGLVIFVSLVTPFFEESSSGTNEKLSPPSNLPLRKEWRTLTSPEQKSYISAVRCLLTKPSAINPNNNLTLYDDWPWIHSHIGYRTHHAAPFLPWHRYFLHLYETTLRYKCGYEGGLVYWDWTLDCEQLEASPVFDAETGFGGDGEVGGEITVSRTGRCVVDGPFAGVEAKWYDVKPLPHCLSRGFRDLDGKLGHIDGTGISPDEIEEVLELGGYEGFVARMESQVHDVIPYGISGDFETFTAPYDPLFFLHHTQLDRLWWLWQLRQPGGGLEAYGGHKERHSMVMASLDDELDMGPLAPRVKVRDVMDIRGGMLKYEY